MTAVREINALVASVAVHVLVLAVFMLVREPAREVPPVVALRLTLPAVTGSLQTLSGSSEPVCRPGGQCCLP